MIGDRKIFIFAGTTVRISEKDIERVSANGKYLLYIPTPTELFVKDPNAKFDKKEVTRIIGEEWTTDAKGNVTVKRINKISEPITVTATEEIKGAPSILGPEGTTIDMEKDTVLRITEDLDIEIVGDEGHYTKHDSIVNKNFPIAEVEGIRIENPEGVTNIHTTTLQLTQQGSLEIVGKNGHYTSGNSR